MRYEAVGALEVSVLYTRVVKIRHALRHIKDQLVFGPFRVRQLFPLLLVVQNLNAQQNKNEK